MLAARCHCGEQFVIDLRKLISLCLVIVSVKWVSIMSVCVWESSSVSLATELRLYSVCILSVSLYGSEVWSVTSVLSNKIDALNNWCLRRILHIHWTDFVSNEEVRSRTGQPFLSDTIHRHRLSFFRHLSRADRSQDHSRALQSCILGPPRDWRRRLADWDNLGWGQWRTIYDFSISAWRQQGGTHWIDRLLVETATSTWHAPDRECLCVMYCMQIARLFLISDILHNCSAHVPHASSYRKMYVYDVHTI